MSRTISRLMSVCSGSNQVGGFVQPAKFFILLNQENGQSLSPWVQPNPLVATNDTIRVGHVRNTLDAGLVVSTPRFPHQSSPINLSIAHAVSHYVGEQKYGNIDGRMPPKPLSIIGA